MKARLYQRHVSWALRSFFLNMDPRMWLLMKGFLALGLRPAMKKDCPQREQASSHLQLNWLLSPTDHGNLLALTLLFRTSFRYLRKTIFPQEWKWFKADYSLKLLVFFMVIMLLYFPLPMLVIAVSVQPLPLLLVGAVSSCCILFLNSILSTIRSISI